MIWDKGAECMDLEERRTLQAQRLKKTVALLHERVPFYRQLFDSVGMRPADIRSLEDLKKLPFTTKADFQKTYPFGLFAAPLNQVVRIQASSGTTGLPIVVGYTKNDIELWTEAMARVMAACGVAAGDVIHNAYGYGLFTGGLGFHYGAERVGATVIPMSGGLTERQIMMMRDLGSTVLCCTPSYALFIGEEAERMGVPLNKLKLRVGIFGAEPWTQEMRLKIEQIMGISAMDIYGLCEIIGPGVSFECEAKDGLHINEDFFFPEVIDPETGETLPEGQAGELVFTHLTKEALPLVRYRARDITRLWRDKCPCGRTTIKMARVTGRTDDMLIIRGMNVFPSQVESILLGLEELMPHYLLVVSRAGAMDTLTVKVEARPEVMEAGAERVAEAAQRAQKLLRSFIGLSVNVEVVPPQTIERSVGKAKRVLDERPR